MKREERREKRGVVRWETDGWSRALLPPHGSRGVGDAAPYSLIPLSPLSYLLSLISSLLSPLSQSPSSLILQLPHLPLIVEIW